MFLHDVHIDTPTPLPNTLFPFLRASRASHGEELRAIRWVHSGAPLSLRGGPTTGRLAPRSCHRHRGPLTNEGRTGLPSRPGDLLHAGAGRILGKRGFGSTAAGGSGPQNARPTRARGPAACAPQRDTDGCSRCGAARGVGEVAWPGAGDPVGIREPRLDLPPPSSNRAPS